jgi:DNA-binding NtrC family response regulator
MSTRVLFVEDDEAARFGVVRGLTRRGFDVRGAGSRAEGLDAFRRFVPHAVLTDVRLPDGDGLDLVDDLRRLDPAAAVVVLTGYGSIELAVRAVKSGAYDFLTKPVGLDDLAEHLRAACRDAARAGEAAQVAAAGAIVTLEEIERSHIERALLSFGSVTKAAHGLRISRSSLYMKMKAYGIRRAAVD